MADDAPDTVAANDPNQPVVVQPPLKDTPPPGAEPPAPTEAPQLPKFQTHAADIFEARQQLGAEEQDILGRREKELAPYRSSLARTMAQPAPARPQMQKQQPFQSPGTEAMWNWSQAALLVGALAGALGRRSATQSLNAIAGMNEGLAQGNIENYNRSYKQWEANARATRENNEQKMNEYKAVMEARHYDIEQKMSMMELVSNKYRDEIAAQAARDKNFTALAEIIMKNDEAQNKFNTEMEKVKQAHDKMNQRLFQKGSPQWLDYMSKLKKEDPDEYNNQIQILKDTTSKANQDQQKVYETQGDEISDAMIRGDYPPDMVRLGRAAPFTAAALAKKGVPLTKLELEWQAAKKAVQAVNSNQMQKFEGSLRTLDQQIDRVKDLSEQLNLTDFRWWNEKRMRKAVELAPGSPELEVVRRYLSAIGQLRGDAAQVESGGYAPTEPAWEAARDQINASDDVNTMAAALDEMRRITRFRMQAIPLMQTYGPGAANRYTGTTGNQPTSGVVGAAPLEGGEEPAAAAPPAAGPPALPGGYKIIQHGGG